jgi:hypothetical protein
LPGERGRHPRGRRRSVPGPTVAEMGRNPYKLAECRILPPVPPKALGPVLRKSARLPLRLVSGRPRRPRHRRAPSGGDAAAVVGGKPLLDLLRSPIRAEPPTSAPEPKRGRASGPQRVRRQAVDPRVSERHGSGLRDPGRTPARVHAHASGGVCRIPGRRRRPGALSPLGLRPARRPKPAACPDSELP